MSNTSTSSGDTSGALAGWSVASNLGGSAASVDRETWRLRYDAGSGRKQMQRKEHWDRVFRTKAPTEVSWFQNEPSTSLQFIDAAGFRPQT
jgi:hypothetical protein